MADDLKNKPEELNDEQLDEVAGGNKFFKESMYKLRFK